uniref:CMP/dCMP-type deaminase domain-containing protein n=1 Tax=Fagus sylvatica TaxID=28930 RepID=A0A2N9EDN9_FAGSY
MMKLARLLPSRNQLSEKLLYGKVGDVKDASWLHAFTSRAGISTARESSAPKGYIADRIFAPFSVYKGKAALSVTPILPTFTKLNSGTLVVDRRGVMLLKFLPAIGERKYDNEKRQYVLSFDEQFMYSNAGQVRKSLSIKHHADGTGYLISLNVVNNILKTKEFFTVPVTTAEFAVMKTACSFALPHILGWDRLTNQLSQDSRRAVGHPSKLKDRKAVERRKREAGRRMKNKPVEVTEILYIPDKPPIPPHQQPTVDVFASIIDPKLANTLIRRLNQIAPLENLRHVKRVHKKHLQGGKIELSVILCLACENDNQNELDNMEHDVRELVNSYQFPNFPHHQKKRGKNNASYGQRHIIHQLKLELGLLKINTKAWVGLLACRWDKSHLNGWRDFVKCACWMNSNMGSFNIDGITGFSEEDSQSVFSFMRFAVELAKSGDGLVNNAAVIVDPSVKQVIASARDEICSWNTPTNKTTIQTSSCKQPDTCISHSDSDRVITHDTLTSNGSTSEPKQLCTDASCLYPWRWSEQEFYTPNSSCWHPLRHAAIVAIESSAARDRQLFPGLGNIEDKSFELDNMHSSTSSPAKRQKINVKIVKDAEKLDTLTEGYDYTSARPYLCTGYDIYLVWEPCPISLQVRQAGYELLRLGCAMALVHQRIRRIFYAFPNPNAGALGSVHRLQGEKSLNHHYAVFRVLLPEEVLHVKI